MTAIAARFALLGLVAVFGSILAEGDWLAPFDRQQGWFQALTAERVLVGAAATVLALRLPSVIADGWFEFRFRRGIEGYQPVPRGWFALTTAALAFGAWLILVVVAGIGYRLAATIDRWPLLLAGVVVGAAVLSMVGERSVRSHMPGGERPLELDDSLQDRLDGLAMRFGLSAPVFVRAASTRNLGESEDSDSEDSASEETDSERSDSEDSASEYTDSDDASEGEDTVEMPNACALGIGPFRRVALTESLLAEDPATVEFVVAHELTHLARRHLVAQAALRSTLQLVTVGVVAAAVDSAVPWRWFGLDPLDPLGLPLLAIVLLSIDGLLQPVEGWVSRAQERSADAGAIEATGPLAASAARNLYVTTTVELDPPGWVRLFAKHPSPPERLEFLARHRRIVGREPAKSPYL